MLKKRAVIVVIAMNMALPLSAVGACMFPAFRAGEEPENAVYRVLSCRPAREVVDQFRASNPDWYGDIQYLEDDVAIEVTPANADAEKYLARDDSEYWYFAGGCASLPGAQATAFNNPIVDFKCCDVGPVRDVQCGLGGKRLLDF